MNAGVLRTIGRRMPERQPFLYIGLTPFIRAFILLAILLSTGVASCVARQVSHERSAVKKYNELVQSLAGVLKAGTPKQAVLQALDRSRLPFKDWDNPEADGSFAVSIEVAEWSSFPFDQSLRLLLTFERGHLIGWGPWR